MKKIRIKIFETYFDPFSGTMIEDIGDDDVFVAERDVKIPEGMLAKLQPI